MQNIAMIQDFFQELQGIDHEVFLEAKSKGCPHCGGPLDTSNYQRKTRDIRNLSLRYDLCCRREGCRSRFLPKSIRFYGRKVYSSWVVILALDFLKELGLKGWPARQTIARWKSMWRDRLAESSLFMKTARGFLPVGTPSCESPGCLLPIFKFPEKSSWIPILRFFTP